MVLPGVVARFDGSDIRVEILSYPNFEVKYKLPLLTDHLNHVIMIFRTFS